ncbi:hypothetical protein CI610_01699 [invertebrate metagenome]|uniref:Uncharacterized protein n=1 Tax=invertebrate metagenome TaxID=1711999 RepID=A0A2H9T823_9ZZZZ
MSQKEALRLPVVSTGAEYLVQGFLIRRNIPTYKASDLNMKSGTSIKNH